MFRKNKIWSRLFAFLLLFSVFFSGLPVQVLLEAGSGNKIVDKLFLSSQSKKVIDNFGLKKADASLDPQEEEYILTIGAINGSTTSGYVFTSLFNPGDSGRTAVIKKFRISSNAVAGAVYQTLTLRRISAASAGTQIAATDIPKKNTGSSDSVMEVRHSNVTATLSGTADSRLSSVTAAGTTGVLYSWEERDFKDYEKLILQPGEGVALYQEAAGDADQRIRLYVEWEEQDSTPASEGEYLFSYPRLNPAATAGYVYASFYNPVGSGKTTLVKGLDIHVPCDGTAVYTNNIGVRRTTASSGGTQILASDVPKKHTGTSDSIMEFRHTNVIVTWAQATTSRFTMITPCGAAGQPGGFLEAHIQPNDEEIILQPGEGLALFSETSGDANQLVRMELEWDEEAVTPNTQNEYLITYPRVERAAAANEKYDTFFNPTASGKVAVVKRMGILVDNDTSATASQLLSVRRISAASGGTQITAADVPKKHTGSSNTAMELRYNNVTATLSGSSVDARLMSVSAPRTAGVLHGRHEMVFRDNEKLILKPGEGITLYSEAAGDVDNYVKFYIEWAEQDAAPAAENEYMASIGQVNGSTTADYKYASFFNSGSSSKVSIIKKLKIQVNAVNNASTVPFSLKRISAASGGTLVSSSDITMKNSSSTPSSMELRRAGMTVALATTTAPLISSAGPTGAATLTSGMQGYAEMAFVDQEPIILKANEGLVLMQEGTATGLANLRVSIFFEWVESDTAPASENEYMFSTGAMNNTNTANYVHSALFNASNSGKNFIISRLEIKYIATTTANYINASVVRISTSTGGALIDSSLIAKNHTDIATSSAEIRKSGVSIATSSPFTSRLMNITTPGVANQSHSAFEAVLVFDDDFVLKPGEGIALYQETAGDVDQMVYFRAQWKESEIITTITFSGTLYGTNESSPLTSEPVVAFAFSSTTLATTTAAVDGTFSLSGVAPPSDGTVITIWLNTDGNDQAALVFDYGSGCSGGNCTGLSLYKNRVIIDSKNGSALTNTSLAACDNDSGSACSDSDIGFTSEGGVLTLTWLVNMLRLPFTTSRFSPGGPISAQNFSQSNGSFNGGSSDLVFTGDFNLSGGVATSTSGLLRVRGDFSNSATFKHNNGTVEIDPLLFDGVSTISGMGATGTASFYDLRVLKPGAIIRFTAGENLIVENQFRFEGASGHPSHISSTIPDTRWNLYVAGNALVNFASVKDSDCVVGTQEIQNTPSVLNFGNNGSCWHFIVYGGGSSAGSVQNPPDDPGSGPGGGDAQSGGGQGGGGCQAARAIAVLTANAVTSINLQFGGSCYAASPQVTFSGGGGSGASATATVTNGFVSAVNLVSGGSGYSSPPAIFFVGEGGDGGGSGQTGGGQSGGGGAAP